MTNKEFLTKAIALGLDAEMETKAKEMLNALEKKSTSRNKASAENREKNLVLLDTLLETMETGRTYGVSELANADLNNSKATVILKLGVEVGKVGVVENFKVGGKGRNVKGYYKI